MRNVRSRIAQSLPRVTGVTRAFLPRLRAHRGQMVWACLLGAIVAASEVLKPWPLQVVFDCVLMPVAQPRGLVGWADGWLQTQSAQVIVWWAAGLTVVISAFGGFAAFGQAIALSEVGQSVVGRLRRDLFRHLMQLSPLDHASRRQGDLLLRLTGDIVMLRELLVGGLTDAASATLTLLGTLGMMLWLDLRLTLWTLAIVPLVAIASSLFSERIRSIVRRNREKEGALAGRAAEALGAVAVLQAFGATSTVADRFERANRSSIRGGLKASRMEALLARALDLLTASGVGVTMVLGIAAVQAGTLSAGGLLVFLTYQRTLYKPVKQLARLAARAAKSAACGERVLELLDTPPSVTESPDATVCPALRGDITFEDVELQYPRGDRAITGVSLHLPAGSVSVLRGESGSGKSTLLALLPRLLDPSSGVVRIDGHDVRDFTLASLREQIAVVFQDACLLGVSVRENIALGRPEASEAELLEAAELAGVMRFANELPDGLDTVVGERGAQLSGGQRQRVALARAALRRAPILVLDEPFAHLDEASRDHVLIAMRAVARGRTVILVTHQEHPGLIPDLEITLAAGRVTRISNRMTGVDPRVMVQA